MSSTITLEGLTSLNNQDDRSLAYIKVIYNDTTYDWSLFIPAYVSSLSDFIELSKPRIEAEIDLKEQLWANLDPKTKIISDPFSGDEIEVPIEKTEIVCPDNPDYYAKRRAEYPKLGDQLDSFWKGPSSVEFIEMQQKILEIKEKYPKVYIESDLEEAKSAKLQYVTIMRNSTLNTLSAEWNNDIWDADEATSTRIANVLTMIQQASMAGIPTPPTIAWRTFDNQDRQLTVAEMVQLGAAIFLAQQAVWTKQANLKNQITSATTINEVNGISW